MPSVCPACSATAERSRRSRRRKIRLPDADINRAAHVAGGRLRTTLPDRPDDLQRSNSGSGMDCPTTPVLSPAISFHGALTATRQPSVNTSGSEALTPTFPRGASFSTPAMRPVRSHPRKNPPQLPRLASCRARAGGGKTHRLSRWEKGDRRQREVDSARRCDRSFPRWTQRRPLRPRRQTRRSRHLYSTPSPKNRSPPTLPPPNAPLRKPQPDSEPRSPEASLKALHLPDGFEAKIVAAEPLVLDPVAFDWDAKGRLWVVEMADYPLGLDNDGCQRRTSPCSRRPRQTTAPTTTARSLPMD